MSKIKLNIALIAFLTFLQTCLNFEHSGSNDPEKLWTGKWFPGPPTVTTSDNSIQNDVPKRVPMGVYNPDCDDAHTNIEVDWIDDAGNYTCLDDRSKYTPDFSVRPIVEIQTIPLLYKAAHACMNESISYNDVIPTFGTHRPLWPKWGEYVFLPKQRWLHNLEHGGIVMLYHPCANKKEMVELKNLVRKCLYRHVITPYNLLTPERPFALVSWGSHLQMSVVSKKVVVDFIKESALKGAEHTHRDGQYKHAFLVHAEVVSTDADDNLCPNL